jgi:dimethylargininase
MFDRAIVRGVDVILLDPHESYPDSVFVEDTAVVTGRCAIVTNPGAPERRGEVREVQRVLVDLYGAVERITDPGTLDGGDVLRVGDHFYVGRGVAERGHEVAGLEMPEFRKLDGGLSCLSPRLPEPT